MTSDVLQGQDGWLFLTGGSNVVATLYDQNSILISDNKAEEWSDLINLRTRRLQTMGIRYVHLVVPEKLTIYDNKLHPPPIVDWTLSPAIRLREALRRGPSSDDVWLDLVEAFRAARDETVLYRKTDSHWTQDGCFLAYELICKKLGLTTAPTILAKSRHEVGGIGDLGSKLMPHVSETFIVYNYHKHATRIYSNFAAQDLERAQSAATVHVGCHVRYKNQLAPAAMKILIFGDSASNIGQDMLTGMLAETARDVEFIWSSNLDWGYIRRARPDLVLYEIVERHQTILPTDRLDIRYMNAMYWWQRSRRKAAP